MKKILIIFLLLSFTSCIKDGYQSEIDYNKKMLDLKMKNAELDYLERLYNVREDIEHQEKMRVLDSLIDSRFNE